MDKEDNGLDHLLDDYKKVVAAVKQAAMDLSPVCGSKKEEAAKIASHLMMALLPSNSSFDFCPECDVPEEGDEWKHGHNEDIQ